MSIDQRHTQIREKAGLEESRLNQEFIGFLQKWSTPIMAVIAVVALGYIGLGKLKEQRLAKIDAAFREFQSVSLGGTLNASPDSLLNVAEAYDDVPGVAVLARLGAADALLQSIRTGLRPGAVLKPDGTVESDGDMLSEAERERYLDRAAQIYRAVLDRTRAVAGQEIHAIGSLYGLAAASQMRGDTTAATDALEQVRSIAQQAGFELHVRIASDRIEAIRNPRKLAPLVSRSELPQPLPPAAASPSLLLPTGEDPITPPVADESSDPGTPTDQDADEQSADDAPPDTTGDPK
ncbi:MAG: hypothetical protein KF902_09420 [Phycisphaeraceae bacterium]|nr:hypothetical protein [Phycisphaeraceae bacterium]